MMLVGTRGDFERALTNALSRYIGYTTAAYDIDRIFAVLELFTEKPSAYGAEIVEHLQGSDDTIDSRKESKKLTDKYLSEVINFSIGMQLIEMVSDRHTNVKRFAPTQKGRSVLGAQSLGNEDFYRYYRTKIILSADADAIVPVMLLMHRGDSPADLPTRYQIFQKNLRMRRLDWIAAAFRDRRLLERIVRKLPWVEHESRPGSGHMIQELSLNTSRHHVTPREGWIQRLGLLNKQNGTFTQFGQDVLSALVPGGEYFWLGPKSGVQEALRIPISNQKKGPYEDTLALGENGSTPTTICLRDLVEDTADVMLSAYSRAKWVYAPQASLQLPIEFIAYRSYVESIDYNWVEVLNTLFKKYRSTFERLSARKGPIGFYKVKT